MGSSVPPLTENNGSIAVMPNTGAPVKSATELASEAARASIAANGTAIPPTHPSAAQPRVGAGHPAGGQFVPTTVKEVPGGAPAGGPAAPAAPAAPTQGAAAPAPAAPAEGQPAAEEVVETPEQIAAREAEEALIVALPFEVEEGAEAPSITADTPETAAMLQELVEQAVTGREATVIIENAQRQLQQHEEVREYANVDPVGFTVDMIGKDVEKAEHLALFLLTQPTLFERVKPHLQKLVQDPNHVRVLGADMRDKRSQMREEGEARVAESRAIRQNLNDLQATVAAMLPSDMPEAQRRVAFMDCLRDLQGFADSRNMVTLPVQYVPDALRDRLTALGIDPEEAAARAAVQTARRSGSQPIARAAIPAAPRRPAAPAPKSTAPRNGAAFVAGSTKRKAAAAPGAGAGAPSGAAPLELPRNADGSVMSSAQAVAWHRARLAKGQRSY